MTTINKEIAQAKKELHKVLSAKSLEELKMQFEIAVHIMDVAMIGATGQYIKEWMGEEGFNIYTNNVKETI